MEVDDIEKTKPAQLKQNRITNIPAYGLKSDDIATSAYVKFKSKRDTDPLNPVYTIESQSRRHVIQMGEIEGSKPKLLKSPNTKRQTNNTTDIKGASPKDKGSMPPMLKKSSLSLNP